MVGRHIGDLLAPLGVVQLEGSALRLQLDLVFQLLAGDALVHKALAALVELQEGGNAHAAAHVVGHRCVVILHLCTDPCAHAQAVAGLHGVALHVYAQHTHGTHVHDLLLHHLGGKVLHDLLIAGVVAGGKDHALGSVELDVLIAVLSFSSLVPKQP